MVKLTPAHLTRQRKNCCATALVKVPWEGGKDVSERNTNRRFSRGFGEILAGCLPECEPVAADATTLGYCLFGPITMPRLLILIYPDLGSHQPVRQPVLTSPHASDAL